MFFYVTCKTYIISNIWHIGYPSIRDSKLCKGKKKNNLTISDWQIFFKQLIKQILILCNKCLRSWILLFQSFWGLLYVLFYLILFLPVYLCIFYFISWRIIVILSATVFWAHFISKLQYVQTPSTQLLAFNVNSLLVLPLKT